MNFLKHCSLSITLHQNSWHPSKSCPYLLLPIIRSPLYSTSYHLNPPQITKTSRTRQSREPSSSSSPSSPSQKVKKQAEECDWPRPKEIPYQANVANLVNLIGHIKLPVKCQSFQDGKYRAITFISHEFGEKGFSIPIMFEDDLAHIVALHLKKNDSVHVKGQLSEDPIPFSLPGNRSNFHVVVQDIEFVAGSEQKTFEQDNKKNMGLVEGDIFSDGVEQKTVEYDFISKRIRERDSWQDLVNNSNQWLDFREKKAEGLITLKFPDFKHKDFGTSLWLLTAPKWILSMLEKLEFAKQNAAVYVPKQYASKDEAWQNLIENPNEWWDNRVGKMFEKRPDFKHKKTGEGLWLNKSLPDWVLSKLLILQQKQGKQGKEEVRKNLIENPNEWWDNRVGKMYEKGPDFKYKKSGECLWLNNKKNMGLVEGYIFSDGVDVGVLLRNEAIESFSDKKIVISTSTGTLSAEEVDEIVRDKWKVIPTDPEEKQVNRDQSDGVKPGFTSTRKGEKDSWQDLVNNSNQWLDFREKKAEGWITPKFPDFKHKDVGTPLWLSISPKWILSVLEKLEFAVYVPKQNASKDEAWKNLIENPNEWWDERVGKKKEKGPDFKNKKSGECLWLNNNLPDWVLSKLPTLQQKQGDGAP